jgi:hypothetical protein
MPTHKDKHNITITSRTGADAPSTQLQVAFEASVTSELSLKTLIEDRSASGAERSRHEIRIADAAGQAVGSLACRLRARTRATPPDTETTLSKDSQVDPAAEGTDARALRDHDAEVSRTWLQPMLLDGSSGLAGLHLVQLDVRAKGLGRARTGTLTITGQSDRELTVAFAVTEGSAPVATGTVTLATTATAGDGVTAGPVIVDDV